MLPEPHDGPTCASELLRRVAVALTVPLQLIAPLCGVGLRHRAMQRAAMPDASIDEDRDAMANEGDVGAGPQIGEWLVVESKPKTASMKDQAKMSFGLDIASSDTLHACRIGGGSGVRKRA